MGKPRRGAQIILLLALFFVGVPNALQAQLPALLAYEGNYVGQWRLINFQNVPYVELNDFLAEREFGKIDTVQVVAENDSVLEIRLQAGGVWLCVKNYRARVGKAQQREDIHFQVKTRDDPGSIFRYKSLDGRLELAFRVVGGKGGYSYLGEGGYDEGDAYLQMPSGILDAQCRVECTGLFDGHSISMQSTLRFVLQRMNGILRLENSR